MRTFLALLIALVCAASAQAQSMLQMKADEQAKFERADAELNTVYRRAIASLSDAGAAALKEAQRAWIIARDRTADAAGLIEEGGSLQGLEILQCRETLTRNRTAELKKLFLDVPK